MKQISTSLANKLKKDSIVERDYIIFKGEATKHYIWFNLYDDCYKDGNFIGTFILKRIELKYNDSDLEFKNKEFNAYKEYKLDDGTWEHVDYGTFIVTEVKPSDTKEEISVTAYDYGLKFSKPYVTELNYASSTITLKDVLQEACTKCDVELATQTFANSTFVVDSNQFTEGTLFGNVVSAVAGISCNFGKIKNDNKLYLEFTNETNIVIYLSDYENLNDKRDTHPYNAVSLGMTDIEGENVTMVDPNVQEGQENYLTINDNPFAYTEEKRGQLITAIFNKINGFGYSSFVLDNCLYPQLECGDLIKIKNKEGQLVKTIVLRQNFEEVVCNFEAPSIITATIKYQNPQNAYNIAKRTEILVNKQEQTISNIVTTTNQIQQDTTNMNNKIEQNSNSIQTLSTVVTQNNNSVTTKIEEIVKNLDNGVETLKNALVTININGISVMTNTSAISTLLSNDRFSIRSKDSELFFVGYDYDLKKTVSRIDNLTVTNYFTAGYHREEKFDIDFEKRTGWFYVGE